MRTKSKFIRCLALLVVILSLVCGCDGFRRKDVKSKYKIKVSELNQFSKNNLKKEADSFDGNNNARGFGSIFTLGKVLNFFPVGGERECKPSQHALAQAGICLNAYDCRQRDGRAAGDCAHGLGVCCVFEVTCGGKVQNNLTYFMSPGFPSLWDGGKDCDVTIDKAHAGISQLRIDFLHFTLGQPNRTTGECDEDAMLLGDGDARFTLCGQNPGQHIYYTLPSGVEQREEGDLPGPATLRLRVRGAGGNSGAGVGRLWMMRLAQLPLAQAAPNDCLQYHTADNGTIKTFNYASNGRHLSRQEYRACVRRNAGMCSVRYTPCNARGFRIGPAGEPGELEFGPGSYGGPGTGFYGPDGAFYPGPSDLRPQLANQNETVDQEMMPTDMVQSQDDEEGSGADPQIEAASDPVPTPSLAARIWSFIWPSWLWGQRSQGRTFWARWSPYAQHYTAPEDDKFRYYGYGNFGIGLRGHGRLRCQDRLTIPCENEYFVSSSYYGPGVCDPHHCGSDFCPGRRFEECRVETSISPFAVSVHFGPPTLKQNPEENIGACLNYQQLPCDS